MARAPVGEMGSRKKERQRQRAGGQNEPRSRKDEMEAQVFSEELGTIRDKLCHYHSHMFIEQRPAPTRA